MKIATQDKDFFPMEIKGKLQMIKSMGFDGFEIDGKLLLEHFDEVKAAIQETGLPVVSACGGYGGWIGDFNAEKRQQGLCDICKILEYISALGGQGIVVPAAWGMFSLRLPPMVPPRSSEEDRRVLLESLQALNKKAMETNTTIYLEPLNRYEDHMLNTLSDASGLIKEAQLENVKLIADFYHMNIEEAQIDRSILEHGALIKHVHLADSHRYQPGQGHTDFTSGFQALKAVNFDGYMVYECRVLGEDPVKAYEDSLAFVKECLTKAAVR